MRERSAAAGTPARQTLKMSDVTVGMRLRDPSDYIFKQEGVLTVTAITAAGFTYDAERDVSLGPRHGIALAKGREHFGVDGVCRYVPVAEPTPPSTGRPAQTGVERIAAERERQIAAEGWTPEHDDAHKRGQMTGAAINYAAFAHFQMSTFRDDGTRFYRGLAPELKFWPWDEEWWKPSDNDPIRNLEKAGALIAAEIDRLLRLQEAK